MVEDCHLLWSHLNGYTWGRTDKRIKNSIKNERERQTYYGAYYYQTRIYCARIKEVKIWILF